MPRVVSYTLQPVTAGDCTHIGVTRQTDGQGGFVLVCTFTFNIEDETGTARESGSSSLQLSPAQQATLASFVTNVGVALFNSERQL